MTFKQYIIKDVTNVKTALWFMLNKEPKTWFLVLWYILWAPITLPLLPFGYLLARWQEKKLNELLEDEED